MITMYQECLCVFCLCSLRSPAKYGMTPGAGSAGVSGFLKCVLMSLWYPQLRFRAGFWTRHRDFVEVTNMRNLNFFQKKPTCRSRSEVYCPIRLEASSLKKMVVLGIFQQDLWIFRPVFERRGMEKERRIATWTVWIRRCLSFLHQQIRYQMLLSLLSVLFIIYFYFLTCNKTEKKPNNFRRGYFFSRKKKKNNNKPGRVWGDFLAVWNSWGIWIWQVFRGSWPRRISLSELRLGLIFSFGPGMTGLNDARIIFGDLPSHRSMYGIYLPTFTIKINQM